MARRAAEYRRGRAVDGVLLERFGEALPEPVDDVALGVVEEADVVENVWDLAVLDDHWNEFLLLGP